MITKLAMTRVHSGVYSVTVRGITYKVENIGGDVADMKGWVWREGDQPANDIYPTKGIAVEALTDWINNHAK